jgi:hypothetical protein
MSTTRLLELGRLFQKRVRDAAELVMQYRGVAMPYEPSEWRSLIKPSIGQLDPEGRYKYRLHGYGMEIHGPDFKVDWDFGKQGEINGYDWWRLWLFVTENQVGYEEFKDKEFLIKTVDLAYADGLLIRRTGDQLYYPK